MILNRIALFFAFVFGFASTQAPEFWQQYQQRLGGAIDELTTIVSQFDSEAAAQHLSESQAVDRLEAIPIRWRRAAARKCSASSTGWRGSAGAQPRSTRRTSSRNGSRLAETFDPTIAQRAYEAYQPAVPTTSDGFISGVIGFVIGWILTHLISLPIRHRKKIFGPRQEPEVIEA